MDLIDLDALWAEQEAEPLAVRAFGESHDLPSAKPAGLTLHMFHIRAERGPGAEFTWEEIEVAARYLFGRAKLRSFLEDHRCTEPQLRDLVMHAVAEYWRRESHVEVEDDPKPTGASAAPTT